MIDSKSLKNTKPIFCDEKKLKKCSLRIYTYLVLLSNLKDNVSGERIFSHRDLNLSQMERILKMNRRTIKKYMFELEKEYLLLYNVRDNEYLELETNKERWEYRKHHKDTYYVLRYPERFRKIPQETLEFLVTNENISELTYKIYIVLTNYQEVAILNKKEKKYFTLQDIRDILDYEKHFDIDEKIRDSLCVLKGYGLIDCEKTVFNNNYGTKIDAFILNQANFYVNESIKICKISDIELIEPKEKEEIISENKKYGI